MLTFDGVIGTMDAFPAENTLAGSLAVIMMLVISVQGGQHLT